MPGLHDDRRQRLADFVTWCTAHITGDEKGEAQLYLDRLFQAFGQGGVREAGATLEMRVPRADVGGTAFADLVWKPIVLIEMKKRGVDLSRHYRQAFDYWVRSVPNRPRYVVLCNFDEFWVYDFETQMDSPLDQVRLAELPDRWGPLAFLFPHNVQPIFGNDQEAVTRKAADLLAQCFNKLVVRRVDRALAQRFTLQMLVALFAEDIGLLEQYFVTRLLDECEVPADSFDLLGGLFTAMNTRGRVTGGRFRGVEYFNGGLFAEPARVELYPDELAQLRQAAKSNWSKVRPEIFGTLFEHSLGKEERHAFGAHFTSPVDIMKIVGPTIVEPWRNEIENATTLGRLNELLNRMHAYRVLDPACGSGNFLYIAYRELKRLESRLFERIAEVSRRADAAQGVFGFVNAEQFFGLDINPFAIELAKVTMMIARKLAIDELHTVEPALPLDNLDRNFIACDALLDSQGNPARWPTADVIIGNPPFLGAKRLKPERGPDYVNAVRRAYPDVPGMADYCVYWFRKAHDAVSECTAADPLAGRAGLVGTQNVRNNQSRVGGLDYIVKTGTIVEAVGNQPWSGEANVHVSITNWVKTHDEKLLPPIRCLWTPSKKSGTRRGRVARRGEAACECELVPRKVIFINSSLSDDTDVSTKKTLRCNTTPKRCYQGKIPGYDGFVVDSTTALQLRRDSAEVVKPYLTGRELLDDFRITRWVIDFGNRDMVGASSFKSAFRHCEEHVLPAVEEAVRTAEAARSDMVAARKEHLGRWWQLWNRRDELSRVLKTMPAYIGCSRVTRRPVMAFISSEICPSDLVQVFAFSDDYSFGILQSAMHFEWFRKSSRLKLESDTRYSVRTVFETFPWPQAPTREQAESVARAAACVCEARKDALAISGGGLRELYRTLDLPGRHPLREAHMALDEAVNDAYGIGHNEDVLAFLIELNHAVHAAESAGKIVERPGLPSCVVDRAAFVTLDYFAA
jgi:hypothetical protein